LPVEKCSIKATELGVVTIPACVHPCDSESWREMPNYSQRRNTKLGRLDVQAYMELLVPINGWPPPRDEFANYTHAHEFSARRGSMRGFER
jgi:hypothetical protein